MATRTFPGPVPVEAKRFIENKGLKTSFDYRDVWREEHASAFTVAKATQLDVLQTIRSEVESAIAGGTTLAQFKKDLIPTLQKKGWWGRKDLTDPLTGKTVSAQLGSPRRLKTIYRANLRSARAAGQYQRAQRTKVALPYFRYGLGPSQEHREEHVAWAGTILPVDHPFWHTHMPINGWGCKCRVRQISKVEMRRRGWSVSNAPEIEMREWVNKRTGEIEWVPAGIDPGWDSNPGRERMATVDKLLAGKLNAADPIVAQTALRDIVSSGRFESFLAKPQGHLPVMRLPAAAAEAIGSKKTVAMFSAESAEKNLQHHPELTVEDYKRLPDLGAEPTVIVKDGEQTVVLVQKDKKVYQATVKATKTGLGLFVTSFRHINRAAVKALVKKGQIVYGEWQ